MVVIATSPASLRVGQPVHIVERLWTIDLSTHWPNLSTPIECQGAQCEFPPGVRGWRCHRAGGLAGLSTCDRADPRRQGWQEAITAACAQARRACPDLVRQPVRTRPGMVIRVSGLRRPD